MRVMIDRQIYKKRERIRKMRESRNGNWKLERGERDKRKQSNYTPPKFGGAFFLFIHYAIEFELNF